jgi:uncharacterized protein (DUF2336 family)
MSATFSLISEIEDAVSRGSDEKRTEVLRQITSLFLQGAPHFSDSHIGVFDNVFVMLINEIESKARVELSRRLAPVVNSPAEVIRRLAKDDDIMVAGPVLAQSPRLATADLVEIAGAKGVDHLMAISSRARIEEDVTDILVRRGDFTVKRKLAGNAGAQLSEGGFASLLRSAEHDSVLAETVALRGDIPDHMFRDLLTRATDVVQRRLLARARPETQAEIRRVLANVTGQVAGQLAQARPVRDFSQACDEMRALAERGELDEARLAAFAQTKAYDRTVAALAQLTGVPVDVVDRLMSGERPDPVLILCKAAGYSWATARDIIHARPGARGKTAQSMDAAYANFEKLSASSARRVVHFWQIAPDPRRAEG